MKLNVILYSSVPNPLGVPVTWPAQVNPVDDNAPSPKAPWQQMTVSDYRAYIASHQAEYDAWVASQQSTKDSNISTLSNQYDAAMTTMQTFAGIGSPTTAQAVQAVQTHNAILLKLLPLLRAQYVQSLQ